MAQVRINIHNCDSYIYGIVPPQVFAKLREELSFRVQNSEFSDLYNTIDPETNRRKWDGRKYLVYQLKGCVRFPTGLLSKVRTIFEDMGLEYAITDSRPKFDREINITLAEGVEFRPYQKEAIDLFVKRGRGIVKVATGGGKSPIAAGIFQKLGLTPMLFLAMSGDLVLQAKDEFTKFLRINNEIPIIGQVGSGICDIRDINVCTVQSICTAFDVKYVKYDEDDNSSNDMSDDIIKRKSDIRNMVANSKCIIFDEVQHAACDTVREIMGKAINARFRGGLSGSPWRDDGADLFIDSQFGKRVVDISASLLIRDRWLVKPYITFIKTGSLSDVYSNYQTIYKNYVVNDVERNECTAILAKFHEAKGDAVLVLVRQINHGKILEEMIENSIFISGAMPVKKRKQILDELRENKRKIVVSTNLFDEGIDVRRLNCLIMASSGKSSTRALQRIGRTLRPFEDKDNAIIYDFMDRAKYLNAHAKARRKIYKTEEEFEIREINIEDLMHEIRNNTWKPI